jgi:A/G-specific adenine glycosylase
VACFAYRRRVPVVDVNVHRLFSRLFWRMKDRSARKDLDTIWDIAKDVLPENAWAWNQSIIELGATICTAAKPACDRCPVKEYCASSHLAVHLAARSANGRSKRTAAKPTRVRNSEPLYDGVPRRLWRGRLVQVLRTVQKTRSLSLNDLGKALKPGFHVSEMEWLRGLVDRLASDGVVRTLKRSGDLRVALPVE